MRLNFERLDSADWYDKEKDLVQCLACGEWRKTLSKHVEKCGFKSYDEYRKEYGILPKTPLQNKEELLRKSEQTKKLREEGKMRVYKKGETAPEMISWQKRKAKKNNNWVQLREYKERAKIGQAKVRGVPKSKEHTEKMRTTMKKLYAEGKLDHIKKNNFSLHPDRTYANMIKGKTYEEMYGEKEAQRKKKYLAKVRIESWKNGVHDGQRAEVKEKACIVCGKVFQAKGCRFKTRKVCSFVCSGSSKKRKRRSLQT